LATYVNGHFGSQFLYVTDTLGGGNVSSNGVLRILANVAITDGTSNLFIVTANSTTSNTRLVSNTITLLPSGAVTIGGANLTVNSAVVSFSSANVSFTNSPLSGNLTFESNTTYSGSVIIANGGFGANGSVLFSNGTGMYWNQIPAVVGNNGIIANNDGIFVNANNGLVANGSGVFVTQGTGTVVNTSGVHVNSAYIATIDSNTSVFVSNGTTINTFTVGTASFFVANGNLGIGNSAPGYKLRVEGDVSLSGGIHANGSLGSANQVLTSNGTVAFWANAGGAGANLTANNTDTQTFYLPMANATTGSWTNGVVSDTKLFFVPSTGTLNATIFNSLSDAAEKTDVVEVSSGLSKILAIRGVEFNWKDNGEKSSGVIAQEIEQVLPHLVITNGVAKSVNYNGIIAYLIEAIRELEEKVRKLENG
jgi:hypothetical protein